MKKILFYLIIILLFFTNASRCHGEQGASFYLTPGSGTFFVGSTFEVSIFLNTEGNNINTVQVDLKFPPNLLQVTSPTAGNSFISIWADQPFYSNEEGLISFKGGVPSPGINTSAGLVSTITFRTKQPGIARISFSDSSKVLLADGKGTDILKTTTIGEYNLAILPPEGPKIFSSTHPSLNSWYKDNNPIFYWEKEEEVNGFSYSLDQDPKGVPDNVSEGSNSQTSFDNLSGGIWYFHLKARKGESWGGVSHYPVQIDNLSPEDSYIKIEKIGKTGMFAYFSAVDLLSGIDHYEVSLMNMSKDNIQPIFIEAASPYKISSETGGNYAFLVRAYDKAGNFTESKLDLNLISSFLFLTDKGIQVKRLILPWWLIYISVIILLFLIIFFFYNFQRKRNLAKRLKKEVAEAEKEIEDVRKLEDKIHEMRILEEEARKESERLAGRLKGYEDKEK